MNHHITPGTTAIVDAVPQPDTTTVPPKRSRSRRQDPRTNTDDDAGARSSHHHCGCGSHRDRRTGGRRWTIIWTRIGIVGISDHCAGRRRRRADHAGGKGGTGQHKAKTAHAKGTKE
jgi:hypothetical protein